MNRFKWTELGETMITDIPQQYRALGKMTNRGTTILLLKKVLALPAGKALVINHNCGAQELHGKIRIAAERKGLKIRVAVRGDNAYIWKVI